MNRRVFLNGTLLLIGCLFFINLSGCGKLEGEFAFREIGDKAYRKVSGVPEFAESNRIEWVFKFKEIVEKYNIGIILLKKELVWVDIDTRIERIDEKKNLIYGVIEKLEKGNYKILITEKETIVGEKEFVVYSESDTG